MVKKPIPPLKDILTICVKNIKSVINTITFQKSLPWLQKIKLNTTEHTEQINKRQIQNYHFSIVNLAKKYFEVSKFIPMHQNSYTEQAIINEETIIYHKLPSESSIAENHIFYEAIMSTNMTTSNNILILSNSLSALQAPQFFPYIQNNTTYSKQITCINYIWLPRHDGISGNKKADKSADFATKIILHLSLTDIPNNTKKPTISKYTSHLTNIKQPGRSPQ